MLILVCRTVEETLTIVTMCSPTLLCQPLLSASWTLLEGSNVTCKGHLPISRLPQCTRVTHAFFVFGCVVPQPITAVPRTVEGTMYWKAQGYILWLAPPLPGKHGKEG